VLDRERLREMAGSMAASPRDDVIGSVNAWDGAISLNSFTSRPRRKPGRASAALRNRSLSKKSGHSRSNSNTSI